MALNDAGAPVDEIHNNRHEALIRAFPYPSPETVRKTMQLIKTYSIAMAVTLMAVFAMRPDAPPAISPLEPVETLSPRATLIGFIECVNKRYAIGLGPKGMLSHYLE